MAVADSAYASTSYGDQKLWDRFKSVLLSDFNNNEKFAKLKEIKDVVSLYREAEKDPHMMVSSIANKMIDEILKQVYPYYKDTIIENIGAKTQFKEGSILIDFNIGLIPIKPYVEVIKEIGQGTKVYSIKFLFQFDTNTFVNKLQIRSDRVGKYIDIEALGIEVKVSLLRISMYYFQTSRSFTCFEGSLKLVNKRLTVNNLSLYKRENNFSQY
jgi:hypothetical protein